MLTIYVRPSHRVPTLRFEVGDKVFVAVPHNNRSLWMEGLVADISRSGIEEECAHVTLGETTNGEKQHVVYRRSDFEEKLRLRTARGAPCSRQIVLLSAVLSGASGG